MTRTSNPLKHPTQHAALTNVTSEQHHMLPENIPVSNTTQSIPPLPGGPGQWDIPIPFETTMAKLALRSPWQTDDKGGKGGVHALVSDVAYLEATSFSQGGPSSWQSGGYFGVFAKPAASLDLSQRIFDSTGKIALTDAYITTTGPSTKVLRTTWTNYGASYLTLSAIGEVHVEG